MARSRHPRYVCVADAATSQYIAEPIWKTGTWRGRADHSSIQEQVHRPHVDGTGCRHGGDMSKVSDLFHDSKTCSSPRSLLSVQVAALSLSKLVLASLLVWWTAGGIGFTCRQPRKFRYVAVPSRVLHDYHCLELCGSFYQRRKRIARRPSRDVSNHLITSNLISTLLSCCIRATGEGVCKSKPATGSQTVGNASPTCCCCE
jgi:hypothetical protein